jgi:hypothetical protein
VGVLLSLNPKEPLDGGAELLYLLVGVLAILFELTYAIPPYRIRQDGVSPASMTSPGRAVTASQGYLEDVLVRGRSCALCSRRTEHLAQLECNGDSLLESYADLVPEAIDALEPKERRRAYKMIGLEARLASDGSFEVSGDVMSFSKLETSSA